MISAPKKRKATKSGFQGSGKKGGTDRLFMHNFRLTAYFHGSMLKAISHFRSKSKNTETGDKEKSGMGAQPLQPEKMQRKQFPANLSGGEKQKLCHCKDMVTRPDLLLMDEPFQL